MLIDIKKEYQKALDKKINIRIGNDDPTILYQEFFFYWVLYIEFTGTKEFLDTSEMLKQYRNTWIDEKWLETKAAKFNAKSINLDWDKVFN